MNIKESSQWEESITLLTRKQRVEGGWMALQIFRLRNLLTERRG